jgi:hypothetical protein
MRGPKTSRAFNRPWNKGGGFDVSEVVSLRKADEKSLVRDQTFFLIYTAFIWLGMVMGFSRDIAHHLASHARPYPWIVHLHAVVFVAWLSAFIVQIVLVRRGSPAAHRKLGQAMAACIPLLVGVGVATAYLVQRNNIGTPQSDPAFFSVQIGDLVGFVGLIAAGFLLRHNRPVHMRLMMLAMLQISTAGFARWLGGDVGGLVHFGSWGTSLWQTFFILHFTNDVLALGIGIYDLTIRRRLHPAYLMGMFWGIACQIFQVWLYVTPGWLPIAKRILGA